MIATQNRSSLEWNNMVIDGFIRNITKQIKQISPICINKLCLDYFKVSIFDLKLEINEGYDGPWYMYLPGGYDSIFEIEKCILWEVCYEYRPRRDIIKHDMMLWNHQESLIDILNHWRADGFKHGEEDLREIVLEATYKCIQHDNSEILKILLEECGYHQIKKYDNNYSNNRMMKFINHSAKYASMQCMKLLLKSPNKLNWETQRRPICLLNAIKYNSKNTHFIRFIIDKLGSVNVGFVYDDAAKEAIKTDAVEVVKKLIENRLYVITEDDEAEARVIDRKCHTFFMERYNAFNYMDKLNENQNVIDLDDEEWEENDNSDFSEDDDWEN